jgi:hypothetical protein
MIPLAFVALIVIIAAAGGGEDDSDGENAGSSADVTTPADEELPTEGEDDGSDGTTTTTEPETGPTVTAGFTLHDGVPGETWASVGIVVVGGSDNQGSLELTVTLTDAGGNPIATESTFVGVSPEGQEVFAGVDFLDDVAAATAVRVDVSDASSFADGEVVPVTVGGFAFDGNFFEINGTATNETSEPIEFGSVRCVAFRGGAPVAGFFGSLDNIAPGATIAWNASDTFDPAADDVRCTGYEGF